MVRVVLFLRYGLSGFLVTCLKYLARPSSLAFQNSNVSPQYQTLGISNHLTVLVIISCQVSWSLILHRHSFKICPRTGKIPYAHLWKSFSTQFPSLGTLTSNFSHPITPNSLISVCASHWDYQSVCGFPSLYRGLESIPRQKAEENGSSPHGFPYSQVCPVAVNSWFISVLQFYFFFMTRG